MISVIRQGFAVTLVLLLWSSAASAQEPSDASPFGFEMELSMEGFSSLGGAAGLSMGPVSVLMGLTADVASTQGTNQYGGVRLPLEIKIYFVPPGTEGISPFVRVGGHIAHSYNDFESVGGFSSSTTALGLTLGGGLGYFFNPHIGLQGEIDLGYSTQSADEDSPSAAGLGGLGFGDTESVTLRWRLGVVFRT